MSKISPDTNSGPSLRPWPCGFTLIEVIVAVGIFSVAVIMTVAMLTSSLRTESAVIDQATAKRIVGAIDAKLTSLGYDVIQGTSDPDKKFTWVSSSGMLFDANQNPNSSGVSPTSGKVLFVSRLGDKVGTYNDPVWGLSPANDNEKYFEVMLVRSPNPVLSPPLTTGTEGKDLTAAASVMFSVRVSWPAYTFDKKAADPALRSQRGVLPPFNFALAR